MLYAKRVVDGIVENHYELVQLRNLPPGLDALYLKELSHRYPSTRIQEYEAIAGPLLAAVIAANEQLNIDTLSRVVDAPKKALSEALKRLSDYFSSIGDRHGLYHKSFEDWLLDPNKSKEYAVDRVAGHKLLAAYCWKTFEANRSQADAVTDIDDEDWRYAIRFGVEHHVHSGELHRAVALLRFMYERWDEERVEGTTFEAVRLPFLIRAVLRAVEDCSAETKENIDPFDLIPLIKDFYQIEPLVAPIEILVQFHRDKWPGLLDELLREEENYVLRYAISQVLGAVCAEQDPPITIRDISAYMERPEFVYRELAFYVLRHLYGRKPELIKLEHLERMGDSETFPGRAALGDLLLHLEIQKRYDSTRVKSRTFWEPIWPYNRIDVCDLKAARSLRAGSHLPDDADDGVTAAYEDLKRTEELRQKLLGEEKLKSDETLYALIRDFYKLGQTPKRIRKARNRVGGSPYMLDLIRLAFSHPLWNVAEEAASELASFVEREPQMISIVETLLTDPYWRVRFGATETAYQLASADDVGLFGDAVSRFYADPNARLRALCAENLIAHVLDRPVGSRTDILNDFSDPIRFWAKDEDAWVLEHVFRLVKTLGRDGDLDCTDFFPNGTPYLLVGLPSPVSSPGWSNLSRAEFLEHIEKRQRERQARAVTEPA